MRGDRDDLGFARGPRGSGSADSASALETLRDNTPRPSPAPPLLMNPHHFTDLQVPQQGRRGIPPAAHASFAPSPMWPQHSEELRMAIHAAAASPSPAAQNWVAASHTAYVRATAAACSPSRSFSTPDVGGGRRRGSPPRQRAASDGGDWAEEDTCTEGEGEPDSDSGGSSGSFDDGDDDKDGDGGSRQAVQRMRTRSGDKPRRTAPPPVGKRKLGRPIMFTGDPDDPSLSKDERRRIRRRAANRASAQRVRERRMQQTSLTMIQLQETEARRDALQTALEAAQADLRQLAAALQQASQRWQAACTKTAALQARLGSANSVPAASLPYPEPLPLQGGQPLPRGQPLQGAPPPPLQGWQPPTPAAGQLPPHPGVPAASVLTPGFW